MEIISRVLSSLSVLAALLLTLGSLPSESLSELCSPTDQFGNRISLLETQRKGEQLSRESQVTLARLAVKDRVAVALTNGKMTLIEAAVCYRSLYEDPRSWRHFHRPRPAHDDGVSWAREVIGWTDMRVRALNSPNQADALRQSLEAELQGQLECYGVVTLPE